MDVLHLFVEEGLWIIWDGLVSKSQENQGEGTDWFGIGTKNPHSLKGISTNPRRIIHRCFQAQWIATKKYDNSSSHRTRLQLMAKKAQLEQLLLSLKSPVKHEFIEEYHILLDKISTVTASESNQKFTLSTDNLQFLSESMLRNPHVTLSIVMNLFSPCLSHLTVSDADLTRLCGNALHGAIHRFDKETSDLQRGVLLKLLSTVIENSDCLPKIHELTLTNSLTESEVHFALIARGGSPPCLLQNFCLLENPNSVSENGVFNPRNAFLLQSHTKQHWCLDLLSSCYKEVSPEKSVDIKIVMSQPYTSILSPLLLLMAWDKQCCDEDVIALLTETSKKVDSDPIFERLGYLLERRATVVKWVQRHDKNCSQSVKCSVLEKLQKFSTLKVLHETGCLANSDKQAVENLLLKAKSNSVEDWEVTIFQGFCVITSVLQLISASLSEGSGNTNKKNEIQYDFDACDNFESMLKTELAKIRSLLETLNPLQFRLEVLENMFSLTFLRYENLCMEDAPSDSGGEEDEDQTDTSLAGHTVERDDTVPSKVKPKQCSKQKQIKTDSRGFVCSPIVIQEILNCLSECLVDCSASFFKLRSSTVELNPSDANLEKQINMLMQVTAEALWRLKLLSDLPHALHSKHAFIPEPQRGYPSTASSSDSDEPPEDRRRLERTQRRMSHTSRNGRTEYTDRSSESSSNTTGDNF
ncbi:hypothetical protein B566_EDAN010980 [Ephemera danica]|nr:hypothetical protein B566_EDAN010980 [Ephemera danica]